MHARNYATVTLLQPNYLPAKPVLRIVETYPHLRSPLKRPPIPIRKQVRQWVHRCLRDGLVILLMVLPHVIF